RRRLFVRRRRSEQGRAAGHRHGYSLRDVRVFRESGSEFSEAMTSPSGYQPPPPPPPDEDPLLLELEVTPLSPSEPSLELLGFRADTPAAIPPAAATQDALAPAPPDRPPPNPGHSSDHADDSEGVAGIDGSVAVRRFTTVFFRDCLTDQSST